MYAQDGVEKLLENRWKNQRREHQILQLINTEEFFRVTTSATSNAAEDYRDNIQNRPLTLEPCQAILVSNYLDLSEASSPREADYVFNASDPALVISFKNSNSEIMYLLF